jgi:phosphoglucomutase
MLVDVARWSGKYFERRPDVHDPNQLVSFGTSGHRGSPLHGTFTEAHILAITQAICDYRREQGTDGPLYMGKDTHAVSEPAQRTALEVLAANNVETIIQQNDGVTPTPSSREPFSFTTAAAKEHLADGIVITPSHNPPEDGGFKYNPPNGGPADTDVTRWVQDRANELLRAGNVGVKRVPFAKPIRPRPRTRKICSAVRSRSQKRRRHGCNSRRQTQTWRRSNGRSLAAVLGTDQLRLRAGHRRRQYDHRPDLFVHDGRSRRQDSHGLFESRMRWPGWSALKDQYQVAFANDTDADRHGIVTPIAGLMNPNHYLAVAIRYLLSTAPSGARTVAVGKTLVSSSMIDRVVKKLGRELREVPVGFKWFVPGLVDGSCCFGGEESAGASFLRLDGTVWTTDKDGPIMDLLAAEITARTGKDPGEHYRELTAEFGSLTTRALTRPPRPSRKRNCKNCHPDAVKESDLAGEPITAKLTKAPGNGAPIGGLKVVAESGWFAARPSGTENIYKIYAESFKSQTHLNAIVSEAQEMVNNALGS